MLRSGTVRLANVRALPKEVRSFAKRLELNYETSAAGSLRGEIQDEAEITMLSGKARICLAEFRFES